MFAISQEELVGLVWRHQESSPLEELMSSLLRETPRLHQKPGRPSWRRTQQHILMFWSLTSALSSLSGLLWTSSTRWNFLWTSWCNPLHLLLSLHLFDMDICCASFIILSFFYHLHAYLTFFLLCILHWIGSYRILICYAEIMQAWCSALFNCLKMESRHNSQPIILVFYYCQHILKAAKLIVSLSGTDICFIRTLSAYQSPPR